MSQKNRTRQNVEHQVIVDGHMKEKESQLKQAMGKSMHEYKAKCSGVD
jgi:hypothetical protein